MAGTTQIPLTTLPVGSRTFGPHTAAAGDTSVTLTIDRTVAGGLNAVTTASELFMEAQMSTDGGASWHAVDTDQAGTMTRWGTIGGPMTRIDKVTRQPVPVTASSGTWPLFPGGTRRLQTVVTVTGPSSVAVSGSIATS